MSTFVAHCYICAYLILPLFSVLTNKQVAIGQEWKRQLQLAAWLQDYCHYQCVTKAANICCIQLKNTFFNHEIWESWDYNPSSLVKIFVSDACNI